MSVTPRGVEPRPHWWACLRETRGHFRSMVLSEKEGMRLGVMLTLENRYTRKTCAIWTSYLRRDCEPYRGMRSRKRSALYAHLNLAASIVNGKFSHKDTRAQRESTWNPLWLLFAPLRLCVRRVSLTPQRQDRINARGGTCGTKPAEAIPRRPLGAYILACNTIHFGWHSTHWKTEMSPKLIGCLNGSFALWQVSHLRSASPPRSTGCWKATVCVIIEGRAESDKTVWQMLQSFRITFPVLLTCSPSWQRKQPEE